MLCNLTIYYTCTSSQTIQIDHLHKWPDVFLRLIWKSKAFCLFCVYVITIIIIVSFVSGKSCLKVLQYTNRLQQSEKKNICYSNRMDVGSDFHFFVSSVLKYGLVARRSLAVFVLLLNKKTCLPLTVHCLQLLKLKKFTCFGCGINWFEIIFLSHGVPSQSVFKYCLVCVLMCLEIKGKTCCLPNECLYMYV